MGGLTINVLVVPSLASGNRGECCIDQGGEPLVYLVEGGYTCRELIETLIHELGHAWQYARKENLETGIEWPEGHYGREKEGTEDFPECYRIAHMGLCPDADSTILERWISSPFGGYESTIGDAERKEWVQRCREVVIEKGIDFLF